MKTANKVGLKSVLCALAFLVSIQYISSGPVESIVVKEGQQCKIVIDCAKGKEVTLEAVNNLTTPSLVAFLDQNGYDMFFSEKKPKGAGLLFAGKNLKSKGKKEKQSFKCETGVAYVACIQGEITVNVKY